MDRTYKISAKAKTAAGVALAAAVLGFSGYLLFRHFRAGPAEAGESAALLYQCQMHPWVNAARAGKCTICGMDLSPAAKNNSCPAGDGVVALSPDNITVLNVQSGEARRQPLERALRVAGTLEAADSRRSVISAPASGRIAALDVDYVGVEVAEGQALLSLLSPDLAQKRQYLRLQAGLAGQSGQPDKAMKAALNYEPYSSDIIAQRPGTVTERNVSLGQYVTEGEKLFTIVDLSVLWFRFDVYEQQLPWLRPGQKVEVQFAALPGKVFPAAISFIEPALSDATRTIKVRADLENPAVTADGRTRRLLQLGMYGEGRVLARVPNVLAVPRTAVLFPGAASYVYVDKGAGTYERRRVKLGRQGDQVWEVLRGLSEGERVVTSGNVLLDAQAQLSQGEREPASETEAAPAAPPVPPAGPVSASEKLSSSGLRALEEFFAASSGLSRALAADDAAQFNREITGLPGALAALRKELGGAPGWGEQISALTASGRLRTARDLADAREQFRAFSTSAVALLQLARAGEEKFRPLKVYHCPMAKPPGLWLQEKGPLRNPYYGAAMLTCGDEIPAPARTRRTARVKAKAPALPTAGPEPAAPDAPQAAETAAAPASDVVRTGARTELMANASGRRFGLSVVSDAMRTQRRAAAVEEQLNTAAGVAPLTSVQRLAIDSFLEQTDRLALALAEDKVDEFNRVAVRLPDWLPTLETEFCAGHRWSELVAGVARASRFGTAGDLAQARERFLSFGAAVAAWALRLRGEEQVFSGVKIYRSPSAPEPGLWIQLKGPARNPFSGAAAPAPGDETEL